MADRIQEPAGRPVSRRLALSGATLALWTRAPRARAAASTADLAIIVHPALASQRLEAAELVALFTGSMRTWRDGSPVKIFNLPLQSPPRTKFDEAVLGMSQEEVSRFWLDKRIRGEGTPPRTVSSPELLARVVGALVGAISYVPEDKVVSTVRVVARVRGGKVVPP
jgi:hypothetical protein